MISLTKSKFLSVVPGDSMKVLTIVAVSVFFLTAPPALAQSISITSPLNGEKYCTGQKLPIRWSKSGDMSDQAGLGLFQSTGAAMTYITTPYWQPNNGRKNWVIPYDQRPGRYRIKVQIAPSASYNGLEAMSDFITIEDCRKVDLRVDMHVFGGGSQHSITVDEELRFKGRVTNKGDLKSTPFIAELRLAGPVLIKKTAPVRALQPFGDWFEFEFTVKFKRGGKYTASLEADPEGAINDRDKNNNKTIYGSKILVKGPDLVVCLNTPFYVLVKKNGALDVWVKNVGNHPSPPTKVKYWIQNKGTKMMDVPRLNPGQEIKIPRMVKFHRKRTFDYSAEVDPDRKVAEANDRNNKIEGKVISRSKYHANPALPTCSH